MPFKNKLKKEIFLTQVLTKMENYQPKQPLDEIKTLSNDSKVTKVISEPIICLCPSVDEKEVIQKDNNLIHKLCNGITKLEIKEKKRKTRKKESGESENSNASQVASL